MRANSAATTSCQQDCAECAGGTQHDLRAAGCSEAQIEAWCNDTGAPPQNSSAPVIALRHFFKPAAGASVIATYDDAAQTPAAVHAASGKGSSLYYSFLPGLSYFLPALPVRPTDRGGGQSSRYMRWSFGKTAAALKPYYVMKFIPDSPSKMLPRAFLT